MNSTPGEIIDFLKELFETHGVNTRNQGSWLSFPDSDIKASGEIVREQEIDEIYRVQLDVRVQIDSERTIVESFVGIGENREDAVLNAQKGFFMNSFHVINAAFFDTDDEQADKEIWPIGGEDRLVIIGDLVTKEEYSAAKQIDTSWLAFFEEKIKEEKLDMRTHWIRLFYARQADGNQSLEILLDNEPWDKMLNKMRKVDWPKSDRFLSLRIFYIVKETESH